MNGDAEEQFKISIKTSDRDDIIDYAAACLPNESCGMFAGRIEGRVKKIEKIYRMTNTELSGVHFTIDPREQLAAIKDMRTIGLISLGNFHSHPETPARPSEEDIRLAFDPAATYIIVSLAGDEPVLKAFHIEGGTASPEEIEVI
jgi:proteasome lid subunit RPN8/RPN11